MGLANLMNLTHIHSDKSSKYGKEERQKCKCGYKAKNIVKPKRVLSETVEQSSKGGKKQQNQHPSKGVLGYHPNSIIISTKRKGK